MTEMKESGIEWIGQIPKEWSITKLRFLGEYINGYAFKPADWSREGKIIIRIQDLTGSNDSPNYYKGELPAQYLIRKGDILISWAATLGAFLWNCDNTGWLNQHIFKAIPNEKIVNYDYFFWLMNTAMENMNNDNKHGIVMQHVTEHVFGHFSVPLPPLSEQQNIAFLLNSKCNAIDTLKSEIEKQIEMLKQYRQSIITETVTKGLNPEAEMKNSGVEWIERIPANWEIKRLKDVFTFGKGLPITKENLTDSGIAVISYGQIHSRENTGTHAADSLIRYVPEDYLKTNKSSLVKCGDILMADTSEDLCGCGNCVYIDSNFELFAGYHTIIMEPLHNYRNKYLAYLFQTDMWRSQIRTRVSGVKVFSITHEILRAITIILPSEKEQKLIVDFLEHKISAIDSIIKYKESQLAALTNYKKSLIYEYVTGKKESGI